MNYKRSFYYVVKNLLLMHCDMLQAPKVFVKLSHSPQILLLHGCAIEMTQTS